MPPRFCNRGEVRYEVCRGSRVRSPPVPVVLSVYQRGSLLDCLAMYLSCDTKKLHDNESTHVLHNFWTSTHRGKASYFLFLMLVTYGRGSVLLWRRSDTLCTSGFVDDIIFAHKPRLVDVTAQLKRSAHTALGLPTNCAQ